MNHLLQIRSNIIYSKNEKEEYTKFFELVLLIDKPNYRISSEGQIIRERGVEELRFVVSESNYDAMMTQFNSYRKAEPKDLV